MCGCESREEDGAGKEEGGKEESVCLWSKKGVNQQGCQGASRTEGY